MALDFLLETETTFFSMPEAVVSEERLDSSAGIRDRVKEEELNTVFSRQRRKLAILPDCGAKQNANRLIFIRKISAFSLTRSIVCDSRRQGCYRFPGGPASRAKRAGSGGSSARPIASV